MSETDANESGDGTDSDSPADRASLSETRERLRGALEETESDADSNGADAADESEAAPERSETPDVGELLDRAQTDIVSLLDVLQGEEGQEDGAISDAQEDLDDLLDVIDEAEELLDAIDLTALPDAVDLSELPSAIDVGDIPEAISEGEASEAIEFRRLVQLVDLKELIQEIDLLEFRREKSEFEDAVDDVTDDEADTDGDDGGGLRDRIGGSGLVGDEDDGSDTSLRDRIGGESGLVGDDADGGDGDEEGLEIPSQVIQARVQSRLTDAIDEFRESVLDARDQLKAMRERTEEETDAVGQPSSRNPTAYSSLPGTDRADIGGVARFSTLPETVRHSTAPTRQHIYGSRFENARNGGGDDE